MVRVGEANDIFVGGSEFEFLEVIYLFLNRGLDFFRNSYSCFESIVVFIILFFVIYFVKGILVFIMISVRLVNRV